MSKFPNDNVVILGGRVQPREPELKYTASGTAILTFSMVNEQSWKDRNTDEWKKKSHWIDCKAWKRLAENLAERLSKGDHVIVRGALEQETWETQGQKRSKITLRLDSAHKVSVGDPAPRQSSSEYPEDPEIPF